MLPTNMTYRAKMNTRPRDLIKLQSFQLTLSHGHIAIDYFIACTISGPTIFHLVITLPCWNRTKQTQSLHMIARFYVMATMCVGGISALGRDREGDKDYSQPSMLQDMVYHTPRGILTTTILGVHRTLHPNRNIVYWPQTLWSVRCNPKDKS